MRLLSKILLSLVVILSIVFLNFFQKEVRNFFYLISSPVQKILWHGGNKISDFLAAVFEAKTLKKEVDRLRSENLALIRKNIELRSLSQENEALKKALGLRLEKEFNLIFSQITGRILFEDAILIDKGEKHGVLKDLPVITPEKILCGKVKEVYKNFSKIELLSNKDLSFDVVLERSKEQAVAKGRGNFRIFIDFIPPEVKVEKDDVVVSSSLAGVFPANLLVGKIKNVLRDDIRPFQQAEVKPSCDIKKIGYLFVVVDY